MLLLTGAGRFCSSVQVRGAACNQFWCWWPLWPGRASLSPLSPELAVALLTSHQLHCCCALRANTGVTHSNLLQPAATCGSEAGPWSWSEWSRMRGLLPVISFTKRTIRWECFITISKIWDPVSPAESSLLNPSTHVPLTTKYSTMAKFQLDYYDNEVRWNDTWLLSIKWKKLCSTFATPYLAISWFRYWILFPK